jgi:hypothetical protein
MTEQTEQELYEEMIQEEIERLRNEHPKYAAMSTDTLRGLARRNLAIDRTKLIRKLVKEDQEREHMTVGDLYGKTRAQILKEQKEEGC